MTLEFGYANGVQCVEVPEKNLLATLTANPLDHARSGADAVKHALANPI